MTSTWKCADCDTVNGAADTQCMVCDRRPADTWKGKQLSDALPVTDADLHYRIYNADTGELLSFGSNGGPGSLNSIVQHALRHQAEQPGIRLHVAHLDRPA